MASSIRARKVFGIDFTSRPTARKPITCVEAQLQGKNLVFQALHEWTRFEQFDEFLAAPGPWVAGCDFPFGQARRFIDNIGWPSSWTGYIEHVGGLSRPDFRRALDDYRRDRAPGDKEHRRATDVRSGAVSSQKLYGVPVALMFYEGAPRLLRSGVHVPPLVDGDSQRVALEAYPGVLARRMIGRRPYKQDTREKQSVEHQAARQEILSALTDSGEDLGLVVVAPGSLADDPQGDHLDALLCAVQAAWSMRQPNWGIPGDVDTLEGWIVGPPP
ncbi:MAG: DUF429 domain-containing protein [Woeseiaceae bacterium]|nr:DUF429 domain-containing protein [Woeseiaceae bacterium]